MSLQNKKVILQETTIYFVGLARKDKYSDTVFEDYIYCENPQVVDGNKIIYCKPFTVWKDDNGKYYKRDSISVL